MRTEQIERATRIATRRLRQGYRWDSREQQARYAEAVLTMVDIGRAGQAAAQWATRRERLADLESMAMAHWAQATR